MKKQLLLVLVTMLSVVVASAQVAPTPQNVKKSLFDKSGKTEVVANPMGHNLRASETANAMQRITAEEPVGGEVVECIRSTSGFVLDWNMAPEYTEQSGLIGRYSLQEDGSIYIYNPVAINPTNTWVKAEKQADATYIVKGGFLYQEDYYGEVYDYTINKMVYDEANDTYAIAENQDIKYVLDDNGVLSMVPEENTIIGIVDVETGMWTSYGNGTDVLVPLTDTPVVAPDGLEFVEYSFVAPNDDFFLQVAIDGNDVYMGYIPRLSENLFIKGTITDNKVVVPAKQLMGGDEEYGYYFYLCGVDTSYVYDPIDDWNYLNMVINDKDIVFDYDAENKTFKTDDCFAINAGTEVVNCIGYYFGCTMEPWVELPATPKAPVILTIDPYNDSLGSGYMEFTIPAVGTNDEALITEKLFFSIYIDGELYEFDMEADMGGEGITTEIPYKYFGSNLYGMGGTFYYYYPFTGFETLSLQSVYYGGGERRVSELCNYTAGVKSLNATKEVKSETYTDLMGRPVSDPKLGVFIRTVTYTDGTKENIKVAKRTF